MNITQREAVLTLLSGVSTIVKIKVTAYTPLTFIDQAYLTPRIITTNPNIELTTPTTVVLSDYGNIANRFTLISRSSIPTNDMEYMLYYDAKYSDIIAIPSLSLFENSPYIAAAPIELVATGINFSGKEGDTVPTLNTALPVNVLMVGLANSVERFNKGGRFRKTITTGNTLSTSSLYPKTFIDFGLPSAMFTNINFTADINIYYCDSLYHGGSMAFGKQNIVDGGTLIVDLPVV